MPINLLNSLTLLPMYWIIILKIPFVKRVFFIYKLINKKNKYANVRIVSKKNKRKSIKLQNADQGPWANLHMNLLILGNSMGKAQLTSW